MVFSIDPKQANAQFQEIANGLDKLAQDETTGGRGDTPISGDLGAKARINGVERTPWVMTTTEWLREVSPKAIVWEANPSDATWTMAQRSMHTKNLFGTVMHVWPNTERSTFYDEFKLHFNFQSGSLLPVFVNEIDSILLQRGTYQPPGGLANFYDFMQLVDAPKLTSDGRANTVYVQYNSNLFPQITLMGMFDSNGISFTDSSNNPNAVTSWGADFIVYDSMPRLSANSAAGLKANQPLMELWRTYKIDKGKLTNRSRADSASNLGQSASDFFSGIS